MIVVESFRGKSVAEQRVEIVERKGTGHPDYICDAVMEAISVALCREYLREFGAILHHNVDKGLLVAGKVAKRFGGGRVIAPMELVIGDRATFSAAGKKIPVAEIAISTAKEWLRKNLRFVDPERHLRCRVVLAPGSEELTDIFSRSGGVMGANDTSAAVGYYPLSPTERAVIDLERFLNSPGFKGRFPWSGEDVKVMGLRNRDRLEITVAMPLMARQIASEADYFAGKEEILRQMRAFLAGVEGFRTVDVRYNNLDLPGRGLGGVYLSLLGTSAEDADSGEVGRGNRVNGIIALNRPMGTEAAAGKNPVSHVGKIYSFLSHRLAREIFEEVEGVREVYVLLLSRIGAPVDSPRMAVARLNLAKGRTLHDVSGPVRKIVARELAEIGSFCRDLGDGKFPVC